MKYLITALAAIAAIAIGFSIVGTNPEAERFGGVSNFDGVAIGSDGLQQGTTGSVITKMIKGTCNLTGGSVTASSSAFGSCAVTGATSGDLVFASLATTSSQSWVTAAQASTTDGFITVRVFNNGATAHITAFGTTTSYWIVR